jgi:hypothetical protein
MVSNEQTTKGKIMSRYIFSSLCHIKWLIFDIFYLDQLGFVGEDVTETPVTGAVRTFLKALQNQPFSVT